jgi:hypothetical protein
MLMHWERMLFQKRKNQKMNKWKRTTLKTRGRKRRRKSRRRKRRRKEGNSEKEMKLIEPMIIQQTK